MPKLRPFQVEDNNRVYKSWDDGSQNVCLVEPCGGGKTVMMSDIITKLDTPTCAIAHRRELVSQISLALAKNEVKHRIIGPPKVTHDIVTQHMEEFGKSYYDSKSHTAVAGVDTLIRRKSELSRWLKSVGLWVIDECHHVTKKNKWGKAVGMFTNPQVKGLGVTATAERTDGFGLGRLYDGVFDDMIIGPPPRGLIDWGYLTDYTIYNPPNDFHRENIEKNKAGEFLSKSMVKELYRSHVIGDIVKSYLKIAPGKLGITFVPSVETAIKVAKEFNDNGVPTAAISADTPDYERRTQIKKFRNRELLQLVNVDLFGEGFDLPTLEVVQMARATESYSLFHQQFMRALRIMVSNTLNNKWGDFTNDQRLKFIADSIKPQAIIIDHVNNIDTERGGHGLPDAPRLYKLKRREKREKKLRDDVIPTRTCAGCSKIYERIYKCCPWCGVYPEITERSDPKFVDGDLTQLDAETLARMRGEISKIDKPVDVYRTELIAKHAPYAYATAYKHGEKQTVIQALRASMAWWGGYQRARGRSDNESYKRFYWMFGVDVLTAQTLNKNDALDLAEKINIKLGEFASEINFTIEGVPE